MGFVVFEKQEPVGKLSKAVFKTIVLLWREFGDLPHAGVKAEVFCAVELVRNEALSIDLDHEL